MKKKFDIEGKKFGRWEVLKASYIKYRSQYFSCRCECGRIYDVNGYNLLNGKSTQCRNCQCVHIGLNNGCFKHGGKKNNKSEYNIWKSMRQRCHDKNHKSYYNYGGRGIMICDRWNDFSLFLKDMGERPSDKHSIERMDVNGDYCPQNCKWATSKEQSRNKRQSVRYEYDGLSLTQPEWGDKVGLSHVLSHYYIRNYGVEWTVKNIDWIKQDKALKRTGGKRKYYTYKDLCLNQKEWAKKLNICVATFTRHIDKGIEYVYEKYKHNISNQENCQNR